MNRKRNTSPWRWLVPAGGVAVVAAGMLGLNAIQPNKVSAACCYFAAKDKDINQPGQKTFIQWMPSDKVEAFTVQPKFEGNASDFGMVIPTPARPKLDEMPRDFFKDLAIYTILMPLPETIWVGGYPAKYADDFNGPLPESAQPTPAKPAVKVLESGVVGSLDYKIIVADEANALYGWLKDNQYSYGGDEATLKFYIEKKWFFTVMKIDPKQMKHAADGSYTGEVTPTRFTFNSEQCVYPLKITQMSVKDKTDALFYVQAPQQMDLPGDLSWQHSYRVMYLTYMLGCSANPEQQTELAERSQWVGKHAGFETTKLEWARQLGDEEMQVVEDPLANYKQMGTGNLPPGAKTITLNELLRHADAALEKNGMNAEKVKVELKRLSEMYPDDKGIIVTTDKPQGYLSQYMWYANREAPDAEVKGLTRLKGHLQKGQWLTKFRKVLGKKEMTDDLLLVPVEKEHEQTYVRIMPTSPP